MPCGKGLGIPPRDWHTTSLDQINATTGSPNDEPSHEGIDGRSPDPDLRDGCGRGRPARPEDLADRRRRRPTSSCRASTARPTRLKDFADAKVLVVIFTCNHCPTAQAYEERIAQLHADYKDKGVAVVAISPNDPAAVRLDELGYTDLGDSFEDMKIRAKDHNFTYPYLYDGETQATAKAYGVLATPHVFIFDADRKLRYVGRFDDAEVKDGQVARRRNAIDALLAGKPVPVEKTRVFGCSTKWADKRADARQVAGEVGRRARHARADRRRRRGQARQERHQEAPARQPLGDLVRPVRRRAARARHDEPHVPQARTSSS